MYQLQVSLKHLLPLLIMIILDLILKMMVLKCISPEIKITKYMNTIINLVHVIAALSLILTVLLQSGKGAQMGSGLGAGSSQTMFGSSGAGNFLSKLTTGIAILFMVTSLTLAVFSTKKKSSSLIQGIEEPAKKQESPVSTDNTSK